MIGIQFHPEVAHTPLGNVILRSFLYDVCGGAAEPGTPPPSFRRIAVKKGKNPKGRRQPRRSRHLRSQRRRSGLGSDRVLIHRAIGNQLTCVFVDNGLLRLNEAEQVGKTRSRRHLRINLIHVDATESFLGRLAGVVDPETKRKIIGDEFIRVFEREASKLGKIDFLGQGTLYPDVIESATPVAKGASAIKTHHNVGGLPPDMTLGLMEPLRYLFKDEVRRVGGRGDCRRDGLSSPVPRSGTRHTNRWAT